MTEEQLPSPEEQAMNDAVAHVATSLAEGKSQLQIVDELMADGWEEDDALELVRRLSEYTPEVAQGKVEGGSEGGGWLIWIGLLVLINLLSWLFGWPFWVY